MYVPIRDFKGQQNVGKLCWALTHEVVVKTGFRSQVCQCIVHSLPSLDITTSQEKDLNSKDIQRYPHLKSSDGINLRENISWHNYRGLAISYQ